MNRKNGYTFVEAILALAVFMMVISSITLIFPWYDRTTESILNTYSAEQEVFLSELRDELMDVKEVAITNEHSLIMQKNNELSSELHLYYVEYLFQRKRIIKTYPYIGGFDIKLTRVSNMTYKIMNDHRLLIETEFDNHSKKERVLVYTTK